MGEWGAGAASLGLFPLRVLSPSASPPHVGFLSKLPTEPSSRGLPRAHREMGVGGSWGAVDRLPWWLRGVLGFAGKGGGRQPERFPSVGAGPTPASLDCESCLAQGSAWCMVVVGGQWAEEGMEGVWVGKKKGVCIGLRPILVGPPPSACIYGWPCTPPTWEAGQGSGLNPGHLQSGRGPGCLIIESLRTFCVYCVSCIPCNRSCAC